MSPSLLLALVLTADPSWEPAGGAGNVQWFTRTRKQSPVNELRATALLDASPDELWAVLTDYEGWVSSMPSTDAAVVLSRGPGAGQVLLYLRYALPVIATRDTLIELTESSEAGGRRVLRWSAAAPSRDAERPVTQGVVRLRVNEGLWQLEPRDDGRKTFLTYQLLSEPGGDVPPLFVNSASTLGVPRTIESLMQAVRARRR